LRRGLTLPLCTLAAAFGIALWTAGGSHPSAVMASDPVSGDPVVTAVGDTSCDPTDPNFNGGAGTSSHCAEARVSARMAAESDIDGMLGLGDYQYACDDLSDFAVSYTPTWGVMNAFITPVAGNHEYITGTDPQGHACPSGNKTAQNFFTYFGNSGSKWIGGGSHPATSGHFSFDVGGWHIIGLNANCGKSGVGGCGSTSPQTTWLANDLASTAQACILAYWHQPRWTGASSNNSATSSWWTLLYQHHADLVLNGHIHNYQRFPQLNPSGQTAADGIREVIAGTGGESLGGFSSSASPAATVRLKSFGYLRLVLHPDSYDGTFVKADGSIGDTFSGTCH
jgi:hypothetical protein